MDGKPSSGFHPVLVVVETAPPSTSTPLPLQTTPRQLSAAVVLISGADEDVRLGTSAGTARGFNVEDFTRIGDWISRILRDLANGDALYTIRDVRHGVSSLVSRYPIYPP